MARHEPGGQGVELLERTRRAYPNLIRLLVTAYTDYEAIVGSVNRGEIYRYIGKLWDIPELRITLTRVLRSGLRRRLTS